MSQPSRPSPKSSVRKAPPAPVRKGAGTRPLPVTGLVGAAWSVGIGLAVLTTITLVGWMAAPRTTMDLGLPGVFRTAVTFWLVAHHAGFSLDGAQVGLLPLGMTVLPGALLYRSGSWALRAVGAGVQSRAGVVHVALAVAVPYTLLAGLLALVVRTRNAGPSVWQTLVACFLLAFVACGMGAARALVASRGRRVRSGLGALLKLLPARARSVVMGVVAATAVLLACGGLLFAASLGAHLTQARSAYDVLSPGIVGGLLLLLVELMYLPNAMIFGMAYAIGPGFAVGAGTSVSPTGIFLGAVPTFPPLAALPQPGPAPALSLIALAVPFLAGAVAGTLTVRAMPSPLYEAAPLWGFLSGACTGVLAGVLAALAGGPLGSDRMATVGPSAWQVGLMALMEVGVAAAIAAWITNWITIRRPAEATQKPAKPAKPTKAAKPAKPTKAAKPEKPAKTEKAKAAKPKKPKKSKASRNQPAGTAQTPAEAAPPRPGRPTVPVVSDRVEFEDPEPVLAARRPRKTAPVEDLDDLWTPGPEPVPEQRPDPDPTDSGGAKIYRLRDRDQS